MSNDNPNPYLNSGGLPASRGNRIISRLLSKASSESPNAKILRAGVVVACFGVLTALAMAGRELTIAQYFGRDDSIDAFLIAFLLPSFIVSMVVSSLGTAFIPVFIDARKHRSDASVQELFSTVMLLDLLALSAIAMILGLLSPYYLPYLGSGFSAAKLRLTHELLLGLLPFILLNGTTLYISSVLNAGERFALPAVVPLVTPVMVILFIVLMARQWGAFALVAGTLAGSVVEAAALAGALQKQRIRFVVRWGGFTPDVRSVLRQYSPMLAGSFLMGSTLVVDKSMAAMLSPGSVAALSYGNRIVSGVFAVGATALSTATFPYFSRMAAEGDWNGCRHTLKRYSILVLLTSIPLTLCLMVLSKSLVRLLYQRGAFMAADTELVSRVQICYLIQIPFYLCGMLFVRFLSAVRRNDLLMFGAGISLVFDIILNLAFMRLWGVAGIALSTSVVYMCSLLFLMVCSLKVLRESRDMSGAGRMAEKPSYLE
jgi:putative peptidoglycan lipid II flippase